VQVKTDVLILGGGTSAVSAALALAEMDVSCIITEETDWIGGQLTSQAVPSDEHIWIEQFGSTRRYREFRNRVRKYYKENYHLSAESLKDNYLNPGAGFVSPICAEPRVIHDVLNSFLAPYRSNEKVTILLRHILVDADSDGGKVRSVRVKNLQDGEVFEIAAKIFIDATELGDLLPAAKIEYVTGFESRLDTGEPSAPDIAQPSNMQAFSACFAISYDPNNEHIIDKPKNYHEWVDFKMPFFDKPWISWQSVNPRTLGPLNFTFNPLDNLNPLAVRANQKDNPGSSNLWTFRRIFAAHHQHQPDRYGDISLVNWPQLDYVKRSIVEVTDQEKALAIAEAKEQSLSLLFWMQTEAPRADGGVGWPGLKLRNDVVDTRDGLAKHVYVRESRRIRALYTVVEQDISFDVRGEAGAKKFSDSVGVGHYRIDLHPSTAGDNYLDVASCPYQIPLKSLLPRSVENVIAAAKNIGVTHITNGCFRLHPTEWNIGESAGVLAAISIRQAVSPHAFAAGGKLDELQAHLIAQGVELEWPEVKPY